MQNFACLLIRGQIGPEALDEELNHQPARYPNKIYGFENRYRRGQHK
jgi:hypothetical protein